MLSLIGNIIHAIFPYFPSLHPYLLQVKYIEFSKILTISHCICIIWCSIHTGICDWDNSAEPSPRPTIILYFLFLFRNCIHVLFFLLRVLSVLLLIWRAIHARYEYKPSHLYYSTRSRGKEAKKNLRKDRSFRKLGAFSRFPSLRPINRALWAQDPKQKYEKESKYWVLLVFALLFCARVLCLVKPVVIYFFQLIFSNGFRQLPELAIRIRKFHRSCIWKIPTI